MFSKLKAIFCSLVLVTAFTGTAFAAKATPVTADTAFDAAALQIDPATGKTARVAIVDLRTAAEYYWVGACAQVEMIVTRDGKEVKPYLGKTILDPSKSKINFDLRKTGQITAHSMDIKDIKTIFKNPISINIPYMKWDETTQAKVKNANFKTEIEKLAGKYDVLILMCRSGKRSSVCEFDFSLFTSVYEIDQPNGKNGKGGFQGTSYKEVFNGYRGCPGRHTDQQKSSSVSWNDYGLPVHIGWKTDNS